MILIFTTWFFKRQAQINRGLGSLISFQKELLFDIFNFKFVFSPHNWIFYFWYFRIHILTPLVFMFGLCCTRICPYCGYCAYWNFLKKGEFMYLNSRFPDINAANIFESGPIPTPILSPYFDPIKCTKRTNLSIFSLLY